METFGYSAYATAWVSSSGHVLAVSPCHLALLRTRLGSTSSFGLNFLALDTIIVIPGQSFRSRSLSRDAAPRLPYWLYRVAALRRASSVAFALYVSLHIHSANLMISSRGVPWGNMHKGCAHARQKGWVERLNDSGSGEWTITRCWKATLSKSR